MTAPTPECRPLADRLAIQDVFSRYSAALDLCDWDLLAEIFTADAVFDQWRAGDPPRRWNGSAQIVGWATQGMAHHTVAYHTIGNHLITVDGDSARAVAYMHSVHLDGPERAHAHGDRFTADLVRVRDGWRISHLKQWEVWRGDEPASGPLPDDVIAETRRYARAPHDRVRSSPASEGPARIHD